MQQDYLFHRHVKGLVRLCNEAALAKELRYTLEIPEPGKAIIKLSYDRRFTQSQGFLHGGILATIADVAGCFAASSLEPQFCLATSEFKINLLERVKDESVTAYADVVKKGKTLVISEIKIKTSKKLVAICIGTFVITSLRLNEFPNYEEGYNE